MKIEELANWSKPKRVETRKGPMLLRTAQPADPFWLAWRSGKDQLKQAGVSVTKQDGSWECCWWLPLSAEEQQQRKQAIEASRATDADVDLPCPSGQAYLPYQRAGIAYCLNNLQQRKEQGPSHGVIIADEMGL